MPFGRVLLEPVRSAEPPIISGSAGGSASRAPHSEADARGDLLRRFGELLLQASMTAVESLSGRSPRRPALEFGALRRIERGEPLFPRQPRSVAPRAPAARHALENVGRDLERRRRSSRASRARRRSRRRRAAEPCALFGARLGRARRSRWWSGRRSCVGRSDVLRGRDRGARSPPGRGRRCGWRSSRRTRSAPPDRPSSTSEVGPSIEMPLSSRSTISLLSLQMAGERDRFLADAFHQVAVGGEHVGVMVDDVAAELAQRDAARRSPCRPRWRAPGRAGRWWSRRPACGRIRDGRASSSRAGGSA